MERFRGGQDLSEKTLVEIYWGAKKSAFLSKYGNMVNFGKGSGMDRQDIERIIHELIARRVLRENFKHSKFGSTIGWIELGPDHQSLQRQKLELRTLPKENSKRRRQVVDDDEGDVAEEQVAPPKKAPRKKNTSPQQGRYNSKPTLIDMADGKLCPHSFVRAFHRFIDLYFVHEDEDDDSEEVEFVPPLPNPFNIKQKPAEEQSLRKKLRDELLKLREEILEEDINANANSSAASIIEDATIILLTKFLPKSLDEIRVIEVRLCSSFCIANGLLVMIDSA